MRGTGERAQNREGRTFARVRVVRVGLVAVAMLGGAACTGGGGGAGAGVEAITTTTAEPATVGDVVAAVDTTRLEATLRAVVGERVTDEQRAGTRETLRRELEAAGARVTEQPFGNDGGVNLFGRLGPEAEDAGTEIIVSAHYDTVRGSPGADDNGSGVAAAVELARALSSAELGDTSVVLAFFDLEERGLLGSRHYAATDRRRPGRVFAYNLDMVGYSCDEPGCQFVFPDVPDCMDVTGARDVGVGIAAVANGSSADQLASFVEAVGKRVPDLEVGTAQMADNGQCLADTRRSDHAPLWDAGIATIFLTDTANFRNPNYHRASDTLETVDLDLLTKVTRALAAAVASDARVPGF